MFTVEIPLPPSLNNLFRNVPRQGRVRTERYKTWINAAGWDVVASRAEPICGDVSAEIVLPRPLDKRKRSDLDNLAKAPLDLLVRHKLIEDDSKIIDLRIRYGSVAKCVVTVRAA